MEIESLFLWQSPRFFNTNKNIRYYYSQMLLLLTSKLRKFNLWIQHIYRIICIYIWLSLFQQSFWFITTFITIYNSFEHANGSDSQRKIYPSHFYYYFVWLSSPQSFTFLTKSGPWSPYNFLEMFPKLVVLNLTHWSLYGPHSI